MRRTSSGWKRYRKRENREETEKEKSAEKTNR
jgi:hypothetical protein